MHHAIGPMSPDQIASIPPAIMFDDKQVEVFGINITSPIPVETGHILGLSRRTISMASHNHSIKVLRQRGGYGFTLICDDWNSYLCTSIRRLEEMPYISIEIETSKTIQEYGHITCMHVHGSVRCF